MSRVFLLLLVALPALAQEDAPEVERDPLTGREVVYRPVTEVDFNDLEVDATMVKPHSQIILEPAAQTFAPMLDLRHDFSREMRASIDDVK